MKIAISSEGTSLESPVDPRFGRAKYFALVDTDTGECSFHDNTQNLNAPQGAGIQAAQAVANLGARSRIDRPRRPQGVHNTPGSQHRCLYGCLWNGERGDRPVQERAARTCHQSRCGRALGIMNTVTRTHDEPHTVIATETLGMERPNASAHFRGKRRYNWRKPC